MYFCKPDSFDISEYHTEGTYSPNKLKLRKDELLAGLVIYIFVYIFHFYSLDQRTITQLSNIRLQQVFR